MKEREIELVSVTFNNGETKNITEGTSLREVCKDYYYNCNSIIVAAKVDNAIKELNYQINKSCNIEFIDLTHEDGQRIYRRSLCFILIKAVNDIFPKRKIVISHSIGKGLYCEVRGKKKLTKQDTQKIKKRMKELINAKIPFVKRIVSIDEAKQTFKKDGRTDRLLAIEHRRKPYVTIYNCDGLDDYFYGYMVPHTGYIELFDLVYHEPGLILLFPSRRNPSVLPVYTEQKKLFSIFMEYKKWGKILGVENVGALNEIVNKNQVHDLIRVSEALHEKKIASIADMIAESKDNKRIILVSGPSCSGKTTFAKRLSIQLRVCGIKTVIISLDDYFVNREHTPIDSKGDYDFEALEAIDVELFNKQLLLLLSGKEVGIPIFNFPKGCREKKSKKLKIDNNHVLIVEGIHGLNEKLTHMINREEKFKIYISALTSLNIDDHNRISTTDGRIIRRLVRDFQYRGVNGINTIRRWPSVKRGEQKNIFPFQEEADIMFNSSLVYELGVLKKMSENIIGEIDSSYPEYSEAKRLTEFLGYFLPISHKEIPLNSILREFIGGSCFYNTIC